MFDIESFHKTIDKIKDPDLSKDWNRVRNEMFVHTRGKLPEKLLNTRQPNEDENV